MADSRSQPHAITAAILAGGRARRLNGADKSALLIGGERTIDRQLAVLRSITDSIIIVGGDPGRAASLGVTVVADLVQGAGALGGIYSALAQSPHPRTLIVACDMPFLNGAFLERLVRPAPPPIDVVMPRTSDGLEPLCAVYATRIADLVRRRIDGGMLKVIDLVGEVNRDEIGPEELAKYDPAGLMFVNVNTPHDYERAKELLSVSRRSAEGAKADLSRRSPEGAKADPITDVQSPRSQEANPHRP